MRLMIDLSTLNKFVLIQNFRMESQNKSEKFISSQRLGILIDLKDAYLHVQIHPTAGKILSDGQDLPVQNYHLAYQGAIMYSLIS